MKPKQVVLLHAIVWVVFITGGTLSAYFSGRLHISFSGLLILTSGYYIISALCFYCSYFWVAPQLIVKRQYLLSFLYALLILILIISTRYVLEFWFFKPVLNFDNYKGKSPGINYYITNIFYYYFPSYFIYGLMYFFAENWYKNNRRNQELQKEKLTTELAFLRSQLNPHFLFNTINDIYSLTYQRSEQAPEALLKLSAMLRYMLRDGNEAMMPLNREAAYIENVIALQRISAKGNAFITFVQEGYIGTQPVASLLFVAFIENAFKHGVLTDPQNPVSIYLLANNEQLIFKVSNKKNQSYKDDTGGIGLNNVRRRLQLTYLDRHELIINDQGGFYNINLILKLN